jgi:hypothetical protein
MKKMVFVLCAGLLSLQCSSSKIEKIDQQKFESVYRSGKGIESAVGVGVNLLKYRELVQSFATEVSIASDRAATDKEKELVGAYAGALLAYKDAGAIWGKKLNTSWLRPADDPEVMRIYQAYPISGDGKGSDFRFTIDSAMQTIWQSAGALVAHANDLYNGTESEGLPTPH